MRTLHLLLGQLDCINFFRNFLFFLCAQVKVKQRRKLALLFKNILNFKIFVIGFQLLKCFFLFSFPFKRYPIFDGFRLSQSVRTIDRKLKMFSKVDFKKIFTRFGGFWFFIEILA